LCGFIGFIAYFWWNNHKNNVLLEEAGEYSDAMNANDKDKVSKLEKLKTKKTVYSDLAKLQLAAYYFGDKDFNRAIHNYELLVSSKNTDKLYKDYAKLMIIKTKILSGKISSEDAIIMYEDFYKNAEYFSNLAVLGESILLMNKGEKDKVSSKLNEILTDNESPSLLIDLAKIIDKRIQQ
jgi:predicted negative regulator of RcsB-dependent stress response